MSSDDLEKRLLAIEKTLENVQASVQHLETLLNPKLSREDGWPEAMRRNDLDYLKKAHRDGLEWNTKMSAEAAKIGNLDILKWLRANGCPWNKDVYNRALKNGDLAMIKWALANGCRGLERCGFFVGAARGNYLALFQWGLQNADVNVEKLWELQSPRNLRGNEFLRNRSKIRRQNFICTAAAKRGSLAVLQWIHNNYGLDLELRLCTIAGDAGHGTALAWLHSIGCEWDGCSGCKKATLEGHAVSRNK